MAILSKSLESSKSPKDTTWGSFSNRAPWNLNEQECLDFDAKTNEIRAEVHYEASKLLEKKHFVPIGRMIVAVLRIGVAVSSWYIFDKRKGREKSYKSISRKLRKQFVHLGSTYIKLGQIISSGEGLFPNELVDEFKLLRDQVEPEKYFDIKNVIEKDFGRPLETIFSSFNKQPLAAASIAQVHEATLITGEKVVVKVQRPQVNALVKKDIKALTWLAPKMVGRIPVTALANPPALVEVFCETISEELDFRLEAQSMLEVARVFVQTNQNSIVVPRPYISMVTKRVLVMEQMYGFALDDVDSIRAADIDTKEFLRAGLISFLEGALIYGVFHGDLHGGNLFVQTDGKTALFDFGITGHFNELQRKAFMRLIIAGMSGDIEQQLVALLDLGAFPKDTNLKEVMDDLGLNDPVKDPVKMSSDQLTDELKNLTKKLLGYGAHAPKELLLFVKNLMFLDGATGALAPDLDILGEISHVYTYFMSEYGAKIFEDLQIDGDELKFDKNALLDSMRVEDKVDTHTYQQLRTRREIIKKRMMDKVDD